MGIDPRVGLSAPTPPVVGRMPGRAENWVHVVHIGPNRLDIEHFGGPTGVAAEEMGFEPMDP